jgi:sterol 24-C-methyltransferase
LPQEKLDAFLQSYDIYDHDWQNREEMIRAFGADYESVIQQKLVDYYSVLNHLCAIGQVEKMYIPPAIDLSRSIIDNQILFERRLGRDLVVGPGSRLLDVGCGRGRIAHHVASYTGAHVTGMNLDATQLESASQFAQGFSRCAFLWGDINQPPFPFADASFDAIYEIQVFSLSKNLDALFREIHRLLKPGGRFGCLEWVLLDAYDPGNPHHTHLMHQIKPLIGAIGNPTIGRYVQALEGAGFEVRINENASLDGLQAPLIENADRFYTRLGGILHRLTQWKLLPTHFQTLFERLSRGGAAFIEADRKRLVTTSHYIVAQKVKVHSPAASELGKGTDTGSFA